MCTTRICLAKLDTKNSLGFSDTNRSPYPEQRAIPSINKKIAFNLVKFAVSADSRMKFAVSAAYGMNFDVLADNRMEFAV